MVRKAPRTSSSHRCASSCAELWVRLALGRVYLETGCCHVSRRNPSRCCLRPVPTSHGSGRACGSDRLSIFVPQFCVPGRGQLSIWSEETVCSPTLSASRCSISPGLRSLPHSLPSLYPLSPGCRAVRLSQRWQRFLCKGRESQAPVALPPASVILT